MANGTNFLIGRGELLTYAISGPQRFGQKAEPYDLPTAKRRLLPQIRSLAKEADLLPTDACPQDFAVAAITLNPAFIAKSYFPRAFLRAAGMEQLGNRNVRIVPEKWTRKEKPTETSTTQLFVAAKRSAFRHLDQVANSFEASSDEAHDLQHIESVGMYTPKDRIRKYGSKKERFFEVAIHLLPEELGPVVQESIVKFARKHHAKVHTELAFQAGNLWFVPIEGDREDVEALGEHVFVRVIRPMPHLRAMRPISRGSGPSISCTLSAPGPLSNEPRVAILDGGLPTNHPVAPWLGKYQLMDSGAGNATGCPSHGLAVTSAFLFGPLTPNTIAQRPFSPVDHIRVLDDKTSADTSLELYRTLGFIEQVLLSRQYEFLNLSLGPDLPIEDGDVHAWTSVIDDLLSDGRTFMTVAVGNNGELDRASGNARIQVPSDCVNAVSVGATDTEGRRWKRATYSAIGPGRSPGVVKPDVVSFGGSPASYFHVLAEGATPQLVPEQGTSFAAPFILRTAVGIRAILGNELRPLTIKALLIHSANSGNHPREEVGWGRVSSDVVSVIASPTGVARIIYQGELKPGKYLRAPLPLPKGGLVGRAVITATFCYATPVDPQDASSYTKAGLDVAFRPDAAKLHGKKRIPKTKGFFSVKQYATESERRSDAGKWETVLHARKGMLGSSLNGPVFDIHYNARDGGGASRSADKIAYALVITVEARHHQDLYNEILQAYAATLIPIQPQVAIPIRV